MRKFVILFFAYLLFNISPVSAMDFESAAKRSFSQTVINKIEFQDNAGYIIFKINDDYFGTGDKINKICAIESARLFMYVPTLSTLKIAIPLQRSTRQYKNGWYVLQITRGQIEKTYDMEFNESLIGEGWRNKFLQEYNSKKIRAVFANHFVRRADF